jgi:hypothetical protein
VVQLAAEERPNLSGNIHITEAQRRRLADCEYWLVKNIPQGAQPSARPEKAAEESAVRLLQNTQIALQVLLPRVSELIFVTLDRKSRLDLTTSAGRAIEPPRWAQLLWPDTISRSELIKTVAGVQQAFSSRSVRLKNPFYFLELGLQANHGAIRTFLWTTGIDTFLIANSEGKFKRRLCNLLGPESYLFPADGSGRQPIYTVEQVAGRMYKLRSLIAHGVEIDLSFRQKGGFQATGGRFPLTGRFLEYTEAAVLHEAALFALCAIIKRVVTSNTLLKLFLRHDDWTKALDNGAFPA